MLHWCWMIIMKNEKVFKMKFIALYPLLVNKAVKKQRTQEEVNTVITWLTGYSSQDILQLLNTEITYKDFFKHAPHMNPNRVLITGKICGITIESIEDPLMKEIRYLDKLIDELSKGRPLENILRN